MSEILNKKALVEVVAEKLEMTKKDATVAVETVFDEIAKTLSEGGKVDISGFGKFEISERPARMESTLQLRNLLKSPLQKRRNSKLQKH